MFVLISNNVNRRKWYILCSEIQMSINVVTFIYAYILIISNNNQTNIYENIKDRYVICKNIWNIQTMILVTIFSTKQVSMHFFNVHKNMNTTKIQCSYFFFSRRTVAIKVRPLWFRISTFTQNATYSTTLFLK